MRVCFIRALIGLLLLLLTACRHAPDAYDTQGHPIFFKTLGSRPMVIHYFADWCKPCWHEIPEMNAFYYQMQGKVAVLGVNADHLPLAQLKAVIQKMGIDFPVLEQDPGEKFGIMHIESLPMTVIISPQGKKSTLLVGEQTVKTLKQATDNP